MPETVFPCRIIPQRNKKDRRLYAGKEETMRTIRITGKGQIRVHPDRTRITMTLKGLSRDYSETLRRSSEDTEKLKKVLEPFGFRPSDLKTLKFDIDTEHESYQEKGTWKKRFIGYQFEHTVKVEFESDNDRLGRVLYALAHCALHPEFRISYFVGDPEASKNELLGKAVADAKEKASVLTASAGVALQDIQSIDYSWREIDFEYQPMGKAMFMENCSVGGAPAGRYDMDLEPDDIEVSDTVTVVWEIC